MTRRIFNTTPNPVDTHTAAISTSEQTNSAGPPAYEVHLRRELRNLARDAVIVFAGACAVAGSFFLISREARQNEAQLVELDQCIDGALGYDFPLNSGQITDSSGLEPRVQLAHKKCKISVD